VHKTEERLMKNTKQSNRALILCQENKKSQATRYPLRAVVMLFTVLSVACADLSQSRANKERLIESMNRDIQSAIGIDTTVKALSVDAEFVSSSGSIFIVRMLVMGDTTYQFWALKDDSDCMQLSAFGGIGWGEVNARYHALCAADSLGLLVSRDQDWNSTELWDFIARERTAGYPTVKVRMNSEGLWEECTP
jgi:hypothetical protein